LLALLTLGLGLVGLLRSAVAWGAILVLALLVRRDLRASLADLRAVVRGQDSLLAWPTDGFRRWLAVFVGASLLLAFLVALAPPAGWDALVYHLTGPRLFVEAGRVSHHVDLPYLGFPQLGEMGFTLGMLLLGDGVASLLHFGYGLLSVIITAALARRAFGQATAWPAAALLLSVPSLVWLMSRAYVDVTLLFYATAAFYAFTRWREFRAGGEAGSSIKWLRLMGVFCGLGAGVKYTAFVISVALGLGLLWTSRHDGLRAVVERIVQFGASTIDRAPAWRPPPRGVC
jgi:4-amino-4-deoxy-L-arabinose transferase-like glycosyltransferase